MNNLEKRIREVASKMDGKFMGTVPHSVFVEWDANEDYKAFVQKLVKNHNWMRFIDDPMNICKVEGFDEAASHNFINYHLHHRGGQFLSRKAMIDRGKYLRQPPEFLMFIKSDAHLRLHAILREIEN